MTGSDCLGEPLACDGAQSTYSRRTGGLATTQLRCHAPHPDPKRSTEVCDAVLCHAPGAYEFAGLVARMPDEPDGYAYQRCNRKSCRTVNRFAIVLPNDARDQ